MTRWSPMRAKPQRTSRSPPPFGDVRIRLRVPHPASVTRLPERIQTRAGALVPGRGRVLQTGHPRPFPEVVPMAEQTVPSPAAPRGWLRPRTLVVAGLAAGAGLAVYLWLRRDSEWDDVYLPAARRL